MAGRRVEPLPTASAVLGAGEEDHGPAPKRKPTQTTSRNSRLGSSTTDPWPFVRRSRSRSGSMPSSRRVQTVATKKDDRRVVGAKTMTTRAAGWTASRQADTSTVG